MMTCVEAHCCFLYGYMCVIAATVTKGLLTRVCESILQHMKLVYLVFVCVCMHVSLYSLCTLCMHVW